jgi:hypothetical protein
MKKNSLNFIYAAALLLAVGLVGCSRESANDENAPRATFLKVESAVSRASGDIVTASAANFRAPGFVFFVKADGAIMKQLEIKENGGTNEYDAAVGSKQNQITIGQLTGAGKLIEGVPATVTDVYIIATLPSTTFFPSTVGTNIKGYIEAATNAEDAYDNGGGLGTKVGSVSNVPVIGTAALESDLSDWKAEVKVAPAFGRIELTKVSGKGEIEDFVLEGVYVNYYYTDLGLDGTYRDNPPYAANTSDLVNNGQTDSHYANATSLGNYADAAVGILYDESGFTKGSNSYTFGASKALAYNLPALKTTGYYFPHLVLKISNVVLTGGNESIKADTYFITVQHATLHNDASGAYLNFTAGKSYNISELSFDKEDLSIIPEPLEKRVTVSVTIKDWVPVSIDPVF